MIDVPRPLLFLGVVVFFVYVKIVSLFFKSFDPFVPFENLFAAFFFGGLIDAFKKAYGKDTSANGNANGSSTDINKLLRHDGSEESSKDSKKTN